MTLDELISKYSGKYVEVAGSVGAENQCVDLANLYIRDVLKLPIIEWTNAVDFPKKASKSDYKYILNSPTGVPVAGDLVIWGGNQYGHIAIFIEGDANTFRSADQNYPTGKPVSIVNHNYTNVLGWLHPIKPMADTQLSEVLKFIGVKDLDELKAKWTQEVLVNLVQDRKQKQELEKKVSGLTFELKTYKESLKLAEDALNSIAELASWQMGYEAATPDLVGYINTLEEEVVFRNQKIEVPNNSDIEVKKQSLYDKILVFLDLINNRLRRF